MLVHDKRLNEYNIRLLCDAIDDCWIRLTACQCTYHGKLDLARTIWVWGQVQYSTVQYR